MSKKLSFRCIAIVVVVTLIGQSILPSVSYAQSVMNLPAPGAMVTPSAVFVPVLMKGLQVHPENPLLFDFILDSGNSGYPIESAAFKTESQKLIKYFLSSLTIREDDQWVNLSPYEHDRMIPQELGQTEMGRDMLAQDYMLKQLTASLIYPEKDLGKEFWSRVYAQAQEKFGTTDIPVDTFNKVWIKADRARVLERDNAGYITGAHLKVMLEKDYLASNLLPTGEGESLGKESFSPSPGGVDARSGELAKQIMREVIIPEIEKEVNTGANFAPLRQMFYSMILSTWYKVALKDALLNQVYSDQNKTSGVLSDDPSAKEKIYDQYLEAFKKGVFNYIKEEPTLPIGGHVTLSADQGERGSVSPSTLPTSQPMNVQATQVSTPTTTTAELTTIPRKYFSGGLNLEIKQALSHSQNTLPGDNAQPTGLIGKAFVRIAGKSSAAEATDAIDASMTGKVSQNDFAALPVSRRNFLRMAALAASAPLFPLSGFGAGTGAQDPLISWLRSNVFEDGMPRSFEIPGTPDEKAAFWKTVGGMDIKGVIERMIMNDGLSFYDGAVWQMALAFAGGNDNLKAADIYTQTLLSGHWKRMGDLRGFSDFTYRGMKLSLEEALFFRTMSPRWEQTDPLTGKTEMPGFIGPGYNPNLIVWQDWKPITGENAWIMMGALQQANAKYGKQIPLDGDEVKLAKSIVPALRALTADIGAIFHAPEGTADKDPNDISNENNFSAYAALRMLYQITKDARYLDMMKGIEQYMSKYAWDKRMGKFLNSGRAEENGILYQGGLYKGKTFEPNTREFAVDVQTWGIVAFSPKKLDEMYEEGAAYRMWRATKLRSGFTQGGKLFGVGYTDGHDVFSGEWTAGAIAACLELALYYKNSHTAWAEEALADAQSMVKGMESLRRIDGNTKSYLYADKRYVIPFGWNANPVPSTASTGWAYFVQNGLNPFQLGGVSRWSELKEYLKTTS
ncbi:MAG: hypothetical protein HQL22_06470, partial [Candidatus Omnitrophica bacterium]|nr:hypothetical protein [Candidatus Omnitrophota bacterium]